MKPNISNQDKVHQQTIKVVLDGLQNLPLTLKSGTALLFCYNLDRHSEDLDFDSPIKLNLKSKIIQILRDLCSAKVSLKKSSISVTNFKMVKDTLTTSRYKFIYENNGAVGSLKIEIKNNNIQATKAVQVNGINTYSINDLFDMKMKAANLETGRSQIRDLYDLSHILKKYNGNLTSNQIKQAKDFSIALKKDANLFSESHREDKILKSIPIKKMIDNIGKN